MWWLFVHVLNLIFIDPLSFLRIQFVFRFELWAMHLCSVVSLLSSSMQNGVFLLFILTYNDKRLVWIWMAKLSVHSLHAHLTPIGAMNQSDFIAYMVKQQAVCRTSWIHCARIVPSTKQKPFQSALNIMIKSFITKSCIAYIWVANIVKQMKNTTHTMVKRKCSLSHLFIFRLKMQTNELFVLIRFSFIAPILGCLFVCLLTCWCCG